MHMNARSLAAAIASAALLAAGCGKARPEQTGLDGLRITIEKAQVNGNRQVEVTYRITGRNGEGRGRGGVENRWTLARFGADAFDFPVYVALVRTGQDMPNGEKQPNFETEAAGERSADLGDGRFRYTFAEQLPQGYDAAATYRVGVFSRLSLGQDQFHADQPNAVLDFVPGGAAPQSRELVSDAACNVCHTEVRAHGGFRRGVQICTTCHTTQLLDPDTQDPAKLEAANPLDLGRLVHRIHRGKALQTVQNVLAAARGCTDPYVSTTCPTGAAVPDAATQAATIAGFGPIARYSVIGFQGQEFTFGEAKARTENGVTTIAAAGVALPPPNDVRNCVACHAGGKDSAQHLTTVNRRACTGCHADVVFEAAQDDLLHVVHTTQVGPLPITNDQTCGGCHSQVNAPAVSAATPLSSLEYGRYVDYAHTVPIKSQQLRGLRIEILGLANALPGELPTMTFKVLNGDGSPVLPASGAPSLASPTLSSIRATVNGPTRPDYVYFNNYFQENLATGSTYDAATQTWTHVFTTRIPAGATGTWVAAIEARRSVPVPNNDEPPATPAPTTSITEGAVNPIFPFNPAGGEPQARQLAVSQQKCNACHLELQFHGNQRDLVDYCVVCHTPDLTDWAQRPAQAGTTGATKVVNVAATPDNKETRTVHFKPMIHRIHMGKALELQKPFVMYGNGGRAIFFDESGLPEPSHARCDACHEGDTYKLEAMPPGRLPTTANETSAVLHAPGSGDPKAAGAASVQPMTSACIACHDTPAAVQHASEFTVGTTERCVECHADGRIRAVSRVHGLAGGEQ